MGKRITLRKNRRFGKLKTIHIVENTKHGDIWLCQCDCGKHTKARAWDLSRKRRKTCGKCNKHICYGLISGTFFYRIQRSTLLRNISFKITIKYLNQLLKKQKSTCALSGLPIHIELGKYNSTLTTASLDRIDSSKPYQKGNVQFLHKDINKMKNDMSQDKFIKLCLRIGELYGNR